MSHARYSGATSYRDEAVKADGQPSSFWLELRSKAQARCDAVQSEFRAAQPAPVHALPTAERRSIRRDPPPRPAPLAPTEDLLLGRIAQELSYVSRIVEQMGETLSSDPVVIARHVVPLQSVDIVCQLLGHLAKVLESADRGEAVARIGMDDLRARLRRTGGV